MKYCSCISYLTLINSMCTLSFLPTCSEKYMTTILAQVIPTAKTEENGVSNHPLSCVRFKQPDLIATDHKAAYNSWEVSFLYTLSSRFPLHYDCTTKSSSFFASKCCPKKQKEHPSALHTFERMMKVAKGKRIVVFLDYDGTLSPIVNNPDLAFMSDEVITYFTHNVQIIQPITCY